MTKFFTPPAASENPPILPDQPHVGDRLFKFFRARPVGHNVYLYKLGSTTANYLAARTPPLPRATEDDPITLYDSSGTATTNGWDDLEIVFWGGHEAVVVTDAQATALTAAGFTIVEV